MNKDLIDRVEHIAKKQKSLVMTDGYPIFIWIPVAKIDDNN